MLKFIINLFEPQKEKLQKREPQPLRLKLNTNDSFGKSVHYYNSKLEDHERVAANKLLRQLIRIGNASRPPKQWDRLSRAWNIPINTANSYEFVANWWSILQVQIHASKNAYLQRQGRGQYCKISPANIYAARGILWAYIYLQGANRVPEILRFASTCQDDYPQCPEVSIKLANAAIDMLIKEPYFMEWERETRYYPSLERGHVGNKLRRLRSDYRSISFFGEAV